VGGEACDPARSGGAPVGQPPPANGGGRNGEARIRSRASERDGAELMLQCSTRSVLSKENVEKGRGVDGSRKAALAAFRLCVGVCGHRAGGVGSVAGPAGPATEWSRPPP
jgi:hypothetical protein